MRTPQIFIRLSNPERSHNGENLAVVIETEETQLDIEIPFQEIGTVISFLAQAANYSHPQQHSPHLLSPIPVTGLGFAAGQDASQTILVVRLGATDLAFALDSSTLALLGRDLARTAQALSAHNSNPH